MKTTQAWGWLVAGVLALGLNGFYQDGGAACLHRAVDRMIAHVTERTGPVLALATGRADLFMARTGVVAARSETGSCRVATAVARVEAKMSGNRGEWAAFEATSARQEAAMARVEANRARIEARVAQVRFLPVAFDAAKIPVICPRVRVEIPRVRIPRMPMVRIPAPVVHVETPGAGPV